MNIEIIKNELKKLEDKPLDEKVDYLNAIKIEMHKISPFKNEPTDCVVWVKNETVYANDYNPNSVAPPEMELLRLSIEKDGFTQPIVSMISDEGREVVDGFHRNRIGKESEDIQKRVQGYLPVVTIRENQKKKEERIASTIRHNRARGKQRSSLCRI